MFLDSTDLNQVTLDSKCLAFLIVCGEPGQRGTEFHPRQVGQTYSPETGIVRWPNRTGPDAVPPLSLRSTSRQLAQWEPMTRQKFKFMALDRGVIGEEVHVPGRVVRPDLVAVAVTPLGFVFRWEHPGRLWVSDVRRLAELGNPLANTVNDAWSRYTGSVGPGDADPHAGSAQIGDGTMPFPIDDGHLAVTSLADCVGVAGTLVNEVRYDFEVATYTQRRRRS